jgi:hypothetical protein
MKNKTGLWIQTPFQAYIQRHKHVNCNITSTFALKTEKTQTLQFSGIRYKGHKYEDQIATFTQTSQQTLIEFRYN